MEFEQGDEGRSFGKPAQMPWMPAGESHRPWRTEHGSRFDRNIFRIISQLDAAEFINVSKDDALAFPNVVHRTYPAPTTAAIPMAVAPFVHKSLEINNTLLRIFNDKLGLPEGTLQRLHSPEEHSGSEARVIRVPPISGKALADKATLGAHTDFGSLSFLHNRLGGLQVMPPGHTEWFYVKVTTSAGLSCSSRVQATPKAFVRSWKIAPLSRMLCKSVPSGISTLARLLPTGSREESSTYHQ
ncbi:hypothetical protein V8E55_012152 [Tylopilus felleus]